MNESQIDKFSSYYLYIIFDLLNEKNMNYTISLLTCTM